MQNFPPALRIAQSVATLAGAEDSLASINTTLLSPLTIVMVQANNAMYALHKDSTATAASPNIIAPAQGGPGRWFKIGQGATYFQAVNVFHTAIPPQASVDSSASVLGVAGFTDIVVFNSTDTAIPNGVMMGQPQVTGSNTAYFRFLNATAATVAAGTVSIEVAVLKG